MPSLANDDDDDIVIGPTKISLKCPITTTWFEDPVTRYGRVKRLFVYEAKILFVIANFVITLSQREPFMVCYRLVVMYHVQSLVVIERSQSNIWSLIC